MPEKWQSYSGISYKLNEISKIYQYFIVIFNNPIIPLVLAGCTCRIIMVNSAPILSSDIQRALVEES